MDQNLSDVCPIPAGAIAVRTGDLVTNGRDQWLPQSIDMGGGRYLSAIVAVEPTLRGVCLSAPVWTCPDAALYAAQKAAQQMAA